MIVNNTVKISFSCAHEDIVYVNGLLDSYDNLGIMRTVDKDCYKCAVYSTEDLFQTVLLLLEALKEEGVCISGIKTDTTESVEPE